MRLTYLSIASKQADPFDLNPFILNTNLHKKYIILVSHLHIVLKVSFLTTYTTHLIQPWQDEGNGEL